MQCYEPEQRVLGSLGNNRNRIATVTLGLAIQLRCRIVLNFLPYIHCSRSSKHPSEKLHLALLLIVSAMPPSTSSLSLFGGGFTQLLATSSEVKHTSFSPDRSMGFCTRLCSVPIRSREKKKVLNLKGKKKTQIGKSNLSILPTSRRVQLIIYFIFPMAREKGRNSMSYSTLVFCILTKQIFQILLLDKTKNNDAFPFCSSDWYTWRSCYQECHCATDSFTRSQESECTSVQTN